MKNKIAFLVPYSLGIAPSQRFRVEQYFPFLDKNKVTYKVFPFLDDITNKILYKNGHSFSKITGVIQGFIRRLVFLFFQCYSYDIIFIHREATPIGPPIFEWTLAKVFRKKIIFDFDDAIWLPAQEGSSFIQKLRNPQKTNRIFSWSHKILAGNHFLKKHAESHTSCEVIFLPTIVDTHLKYNQPTSYPNHHPIFVGWTGSHSTFAYLEDFIPTLREIYKMHPFCLYIISDKDPNIDFPDYLFVKWNATTEIEDLRQIDIGIMPMKDNQWAKGKCGFKLIQYGALGIPSIADYTEANATIVLHEQTGFICRQTSDWNNYLAQLLQDVALRKKLGESALEQIQKNFSLQRYSMEFLNILTK